MKTITRKIFLFVLALVSSSYAQSDVVLNEILANEPKSWVSLEWIELFNNSDADIDLAGWKLVEGSDTTTLPSIIISTKGYLVLARKLISGSDSISFEGYWGDNSKIWGDSPEENFPALEVKISLTNGCDSVRLIDTSGNTEQFVWIKDSGDGISWERVSAEVRADNADNWWGCVDSSGSTPGRKNSVSVDYSSRIELEIAPNPFSPDKDGFEDELEIKYALPAKSNLTLKIYDTKGRLVKTLMDEREQVSGKIVWNGRDDQNRSVRVGMYILYAKASGIQTSTAKITFAVARR